MPASRPAIAASVAALSAVLIALTAWLTGAFATAAVGPVGWTTVASQPFGTLEASGIAAGGKLYSFGGYDVPRTATTYTPTARSYVYTPTTNSWAAIAPLPAFNGTGNGGVTHAGIATDETSIYLAGGYSSDAAGSGQIFGSREVYRYDIATNSYTRLRDLPAERAAGGLAVIGNQLHFFGGTNRARRPETPEHWALDLADPAAGWVARAPMPNPRNHLGSTVAGGKIYSVGGQVGQDQPAISQGTLNAYDPATDSWTTLPPMPTALSHLVATTVDGQVVVLGGQSSYNVAVRSTYAFDPATNAWTALTPLPSPRFAGVTGTIGGSIYYAGGSSSAVTYKGTPELPPVDDGTRRFNFQPSSSAIPAGYTADTGLPFSTTRGFGWVREDSLTQSAHVGVDLTPNTRERNVNSDQRLDTLIQFQAPASAPAGQVKTPSAWEFAVAAGSYEVTLAVGDPSYLDSVHRVRVEGRVAIAGFTPTSATRSATATVTVAVSDGRLTLDAIGGTNTKLDYVTVKPVTVAPPSSSDRLINFQPDSAVVPAGYEKDTGAAYSATRGSGWVRQDSVTQATRVPLDLTPNTRKRNLSTDQRLDTFIHMQSPTSGTNVTVPGAYEVAVPNGTYDVTAWVGDAGPYYDSTNRIRAEGTVLLPGFVPTASVRSASATVSTTVTDGRLTIDAIGGSNTKLDALMVVAKPAA